MGWIKKLTAVMGCLLLSGIAYSKPAVPDHTLTTKAHVEAYHTINQVYMPVSNFGTMGQVGGVGPADSWPTGTGEHYIYGMGPWIGTMIGGKPLVSCGYDYHGGQCDFCAGPPEHVSDYRNLGRTAHPEDRVLMSTNPDDIVDWPFLDESGEPILISQEDGYAIYNDLLSEYHQWEPNTGPLGIVVRQVSFGWSTPLYENALVFLFEFENITDYTLTDLYCGFGCDMDVGDAANDLVGCDMERSMGYTFTPGDDAGMTVSPPPYYIGIKFLQGPKADDIVYVADGPDNPDYPDAVRDTVYPGEHLPLTAFNKSTIDWDADSEIRRWRMLAGFNIETGERDPWIGVTDETPADKRMLLGAGPFDLESGEVDTLVVAALFSNGTTGGFEYLLSEADAMQAVYDANWAVAGPPDPPVLTPIPGDKKVTLIWDNAPECTPDEFHAVMESGGDTVYRKYDFEGYRLWKSRTGLSGDWELLGEWDLENEITLMPGDMLIVSENDTITYEDETNNLGLQHHFVDTDVLNGVTYYYGITAFDYNTRGIYPNESTVWLSMESGRRVVTCIPRTETDNFTTPFISTPVSGANNNTTSLSIEAEIIGDIAVEDREYTIRWDEITTLDNQTPVYAYNVYWDGHSLSPAPISVITYYEAVETSVYEFVPEVKDSIILQTPDSIHILRNIHYDTIGVDSSFMWRHGFDNAFDGICIIGDIDVDLGSRCVLREYEAEYTLRAVKNIYGEWVDTVIISIDTIINNVFCDSIADYFALPDTIIVIEDIGTEYQQTPTINQFYSGGLIGNRWAYRGGSDIEIYWDLYNGSHDTLTARFIDAETGAEIPYDSSFGDNWCFIKLVGQKPQPILIRGQTYAEFYVSGVKCKFAGGPPLNWNWAPDSGDVWRIYSSAPSVPPVSGNVFTITAEKFGYTETSKLSDIKVVPNPYIVRAIWDKSEDYRKIQFTHLPSQCTIRIYNLAGDLIQKIEHSSGDEGKLGGTAEWNILTKHDQIPASGIYIYHISTPSGEEKIGKFAVVR